MNLKHVIADRACQPFNGALSPKGYGQLSHGRHGHRKAHRLAYELAFGPIPAGMLVCHSCDNPCCVNTEHLWLGTPQDNMTDKTLKGRQRSGNQKLTEIDVADIRKQTTPFRYGALSALGRKYGVCPSTIAKIRDGVLH